MDFSDEMRVAVIGSSGGIGCALADQLENDPRVSQLYRISRSKTCGDTVMMN